MVEMKKNMRMCDMNGYIAASVFAFLNENDVNLCADAHDDIIIVTDADVNELVYPEGWYVAKGTFRNKHNSSTGLYEELPIMRSNGTFLK